MRTEDQLIAWRPTPLERIPTPDILEALLTLNLGVQRIVSSVHGVVTKAEADRLSALEAELLRRGDQGLMLGLRDEYGDRFYTPNDIAAIG